MRSSLRTACFAVTILSASVCPCAVAEEPILPVPPQQNVPWTPPKNRLPRFLESTTATLFEQGLSDPRGCDYRVITLKVGSVQGGHREVETGGWVLPGDDGKRRYAVAWNGLVYPLISVGRPIDLANDILAMLGAAELGRVGTTRRRSGQSRFNGHDAISEEACVSVETMLPMKVCLLLRLNRADLAEAVWATGTGIPTPEGPRPRIDLKMYGITYLTLAQDLAWYQFDRAICAHMRGDDALALADARMLTSLRRAVELKADAMGFPRENPRFNGGKFIPHLKFLDQLPELLDDQERRAKERAEAPEKPRPDGSENPIAAAIRDLDQIAVLQWGQPGTVDLGESPIIKDLIAQGAAAVQPLIDDYRKEKRLTRSVEFGRGSLRNRTILHADRAAYAALAGILETEDFGPAPPPGKPRTRQEVADQIQRYWDQNQ